LERSSLFQLTRARTLEFLREPEVIFWVFAFPLLLSVVLGVAFRERPPERIPIGVERGTHAERHRAAIEASDALSAEIVDPDEAQLALANGRLALVVLDTDPPTYRYDPTRPDSRMARLEVDDALQEAAGRRDAFAAATVEESAPGSRYIDFLIPGLLGMNLMGTGLWSVGFALVQSRSGKLLKLFVASPLRRWQLLASQALARALFLCLEVSVLVSFAVLVLDVPLRGSILLLATVALLGGAAFVGVGLLVAARPRTLEGVSGLMNLAMFPGWILSGTFFSTERFPDAMQPFVQALPLTALNDALRAVMLEGAGITAVAGELGILLLWGVACFALALKFFRWQ
jgi:ABC-type multidrug transport system permease subunit